METQDIFQCMSALRPGSLWKMHEENNPIPENKLENVLWDSPDVVTPTMHEIEEYYNNIFKPNLLITKLRKKRNILLGLSDWTQTNDIIMENENQWKEYRQALRDLPSITENPENPTWPEPPQVKISCGSTTLTQLKTLHTQLEEELQTTQTQIGDTQTQLGDTQTQLGDTQTQLETTQTHLETTQTQLGDLQTQLEDTRTQLETTQTQLGGDLQSAHNQLQNTRTELEITNLKLHNAEARIGTLEQTMTSILSKLNV